MSHFAELTDDFSDYFEVKRVLVVSQEYIDSGQLGDPSNWVKTSYNTRGGIHYAPNSNDPDGGIALRKNYAGEGMIYDKEKDAFYYKQPYPSWVLNQETFLWEAPIPKPDGIYIWNEETISWDEAV
tara:strand:+ start:322 stop:699 length:378 start_codon:yes stop_codon:yes gene_type:complete